MLARRARGLYKAEPSRLVRSLHRLATAGNTANPTKPSRFLACVATRASISVDNANRVPLTNHQLRQHGGWQDQMAVNGCVCCNDGADARSDCGLNNCGLSRSCRSGAIFKKRPRYLSIVKPGTPLIIMIVMLLVCKFRGPGVFGDEILSVI